MPNPCIVHFEVGGTDEDMIVEPYTVPDGPVNVKHRIVTKGIAQAVETVQENDAALVAPLEGVDGCEDLFPCLKEFVCSMRGEQRITLR